MKMNGEEGVQMKKGKQPAGYFGFVNSWAWVMNKIKNVLTQDLTPLFKQSERITKPSRHDIPPRIQAQIETAYSWYYQLYYSGKK